MQGLGIKQGRTAGRWALAAVCLAMTMGAGMAQQRPQGACDLYAAAGDACVAAHSTTRALLANYHGPLYEVVRQSDGKSLKIGVVEPSAAGDGGGYADAAAQDAFCAQTVCWITRIYDQSGRHNDLTQAPRGGFSGPALGGFNNVPLADMAPVMVMGHKVYGVLIEPGMGLRNDDPRGTAVDDQAEGQYWVINGHHFNSGCCFDYGNAEIDSRDDDNGTMETTYFGDAPYWYHGTMPGPWVMTDQENNLVGCVNPDGSKECRLPNISWRFVTAMAKGRPHAWSSLGGDAQHGALQTMFRGERVNATYDPMRKQGAILLGNGGDNSNGSQGTFYEGAMTEAGSYPSDATDQTVQANVVQAHYGEVPLSVAANVAAHAEKPSGVQSFVPSQTQETTVTFRNTLGQTVTGVKLSLAVPQGWSAKLASGQLEAATLAAEDSLHATFLVTAGAAPWNGDLKSEATWNMGGKQHRMAAVEKARSNWPVKINEFRIRSGPPMNATNSFIELYNAADAAVDLSGWSLTVHPTQQAVFSRITIPAKTTLKAHGFYLLGLADSGLAVQAAAGSRTVFVRDATGMKAGDTIQIGWGSHAESHRIANVGTAASNPTTVWQPLPDGPVIRIPVGARNVPVMDVSGFAVGQKMAIGYGATYPTVPEGRERMEVVTVTAVGKPGSQQYLATDAAAGSRTLQVTDADRISAGDHIRLDIASKGHGMETVTVASVGTSAARSNLTADAAAGATEIHLRSVKGFQANSVLLVGRPGAVERVKIQAVLAQGMRGGRIQFQPALQSSHIRDEGVVEPGTGVELTAPLRFAHAANLPFSDRGTGINFTPATRFAHGSNEPVQALGTGITLDAALGQSHGIHAVVRDAAVTTAGYQDSAKPDQWFGGPELTTESPLFGRTIPVSEGSLILRDARGNVADSLNYGGLVDPWAAEGYQSASGVGRSGCFAPAPSATGAWPMAAAADVSTGRYPDGADTDSNCDDFRSAPATLLSLAAEAGASNLKVASVSGFFPGETVRVDSGSALEAATIASVGTAGGTTLTSAVEAGATSLAVGSAAGFAEGESILIGNGQETAVIAAVRRFPVAAILLRKPLTNHYAAGETVSGSGITLSTAMRHSHASRTNITGDLATPGAPNSYQSSQP